LDSGAEMSRSDDFKRRQSERAFAEHAAPVLAHPERYAPLKVARVRAGLTQAQLAEAAHVSVWPIASLESGGYSHMNQKLSIANALKLKASELWA
jgi:DNA-binding XRE family transcriptional regulator